MIHHNHFKTFLIETYGNTSALLVKDNDPSSPTGIRNWKSTDTANLDKWLRKYTPPQPTGKPKEAPADPICLNVRQAAEKAGVGTKTIRSWMTRTTDPLPHMRDGRRVIIPLTTFTNWLEQQSMSPHKHHP